MPFLTAVQSRIPTGAPGKVASDLTYSTIGEGPGTVIVAVHYLLIGVRPDTVLVTAHDSAIGVGLLAAVKYSPNGVGSGMVLVAFVM